jgi:hypothetical protein
MYTRMPVVRSKLFLSAHVLSVSLLIWWLTICLLFACRAGKHNVYGAWRTSDDGFSWKPRLEENVLECLGPENCPGLNCETDWDACITDDSMSCHDWWPLLDAAEQTKVKDLYGFCIGDALVFLQSVKSEELRRGQRALCDPARELTAST